MHEIAIDMPGQRPLTASVVRLPEVVDAVVHLPQGPGYVVPHRSEYQGARQKRTPSITAPAVTKWRGPGGERVQVSVNLLARPPTVLLVVAG